MKYFSVPSDFKKETIDKYCELNNEYTTSRVIETYGNISVANWLSSGRTDSQIPKVDFMQLFEYIEYSNKKGIDFNYTINAPHYFGKEYTQEGVNKFIEFIKNLYDGGCRSLTIALPSIIELVRSTGLDFKIKASTICEITNANKALFYKQLNMERIVADESINRDFTTLKNIRQVFGDKIEIIVNPICFKDCIYRMFHYNQIANNSRDETEQIGINYFEHRCVLQRFSNIANMLRLSWIRPEDLKFYSQIGINYFKLQGRHLVLKGDPVRTLRAYFDESYDGDLMNLINMFHSANNFRIPIDNKRLDGFLKPFYEKSHFCKSQCSGCNYCEEFAKKAIDFDKAKEIAKYSKKFYDEYDQFNNILEKANKAKDKNEVNKYLDFEFDLDINP